MGFSALSIILLVSLLTIASTSPVTSTSYSKDKLILPSKDDFYTPPAGYENTAPGTILRSRTPPAPIAAFYKIPISLKSSHQILYRTNDAQGNPQATVTTVLVPHGANMSRIVSYQDFEDSACFDCSTSFSLQEGSGSNTSLSKSDSLLAGGMLAKGWVIVFPDYEGPKSVVFSGMNGAHATLDGIRAVCNSQDITKIAPKDKVEVQMWGYSGGSIPTEWAAEIQPSYAPELNIKSAVVGGLITSISQSIMLINKGPSAGLGLTGLNGFLNEYPHLTDFFNSNLIPEKRDDFFKAGSACAAAILDEFENVDVGDYFKDGIATLSKPEIASLMQEDGEMGYHGLPQIPLFFYKGINDEISSVECDDKLVDSYCQQGIESLIYERSYHGSHTPVAVLGAPGAVDYMNDRFNGVPAPKGCLIRNVTIPNVDLSCFGESYAQGVEQFVEEFFEEYKSFWTNIKDKVSNWWNNLP